MAILSAGFGRALGGSAAVRLAPVLGTVSFVFGAWYTLAALGLAPYVF